MTRHEDEAMGARGRLLEAERALAELGDLAQARAQIDDLRMTVEAARITMMSRRSAHDELRREGEARTKRSQEVIKEISGWRHRLETAEKRSAELVERKAASEAELAEAQAAPRKSPPTRRAGAGDRRGRGAQGQGADALSAAEGALREATLAEREAERWRPRRARRAPGPRPAARRPRDRGRCRRTDRRRRASDAEPIAAGKAGCDPDQMPGAEALEADVNRLKRQRDALGAVNLRAEEDAKEVQDEHDTLVPKRPIWKRRSRRSGPASQV